MSYHGRCGGDCARGAHCAKAARPARNGVSIVRKLANSLLFDFHDTIANLPGSTAARELVVHRALKYLEQIAAEGHNDPATCVTLPLLTSASG